MKFTRPKRWVTIAIIASLVTAAIYVGGLVAMNRMMAAACQSQSLCNIKLIAMGAHMYSSCVEVPSTLPTMTWTHFGHPLHSWQAKILPFLESSPVYDSIDFSQPWDDPVNTRAMAMRMKLYLAPDQSDQPIEGRGVSHYAGNVEIFLTDRAKRLEDPQSFPRGISNTILIGEAATNHRAWGDPLNVRDPRLGVNQHPEGFGAPNRKPAFAMADGSTRVFDPKELQEYLDLLKESP